MWEALAGIGGIIGAVAGLIALHRASRANRLSARSNKIAEEANTLAEKGNTIAKVAKDVSSEALEIAKKAYVAEYLANIRVSHTYARRLIEPHGFFLVARAINEGRIGVLLEMVGIQTWESEHIIFFPPQHSIDAKGATFPHALQPGATFDARSSPESSVKVLQA